MVVWDRRVCVYMRLRVCVCVCVCVRVISIVSLFEKKIVWCLVMQCVHSVLISFSDSEIE